MKHDDPESDQPAREASDWWPPEGDDGGPAFPVENANTWQGHGMTLRDYFATHATEDDLREQAEVIRARQIRENGLGILPDGWRSRARYMHADAMLAARSV